MAIQKGIKNQDTDNNSDVVVDVNEEGLIKVKGQDKQGRKVENKVLETDSVEKSSEDDGIFIRGEDFPSVNKDDKSKKGVGKIIK